MSARFSIVMLSVAAGFLAACGGAGEEPALNQTRPSTAYADYQARMADLDSTWAGAPYSDPASLPVSGGAQYGGILDIAVENGGAELALSGVLALNASFAGNTISGAAGSFIDEQDRDYGGQLVLSNGAIDRGADPSVDYTFGADIDGTLTAPSGDIAIAAYLNGDFLGTAQSAATGVVAGTSVTGAGAGYAFGSFTAEQQ